MNTWYIMTDDGEYTNTVVVRSAARVRQNPKARDEVFVGRSLLIFSSTVLGVESAVGKARPQKRTKRR